MTGRDLSHFHDRPPMGGDRRVRALCRGLVLRCLAALLVMAALAVLKSELLRRQAAEMERDAQVINLAGRQRMLLVRIGYEVSQLAGREGTAPRRPPRTRLLTCLDRIAVSHETLADGDVVKTRASPPVRAHFDEPPDQLDDRVRAFIARARRVARLPDGRIAGHPDVQSLLDEINNGRLLESLDALVDTMQRESESRMAGFQRLGTVLLVAQLAALGLVGLFILSPMIRRVRRSTCELTEVNRALDRKARELQHAVDELRSHREELRKRAVAMNRMMSDLDSMEVNQRKLEQEIAERKRVEACLRERDEQLQHAQKMKAIGTLAGGVAHEFNNLLQAIRGFVRFAIEELDPGCQPHQDLQQALEAADRAADLTGQLLSFSRKQPLKRKRIGANRLVRDLHKLLRPLIGERIRVALQLDEQAGMLLVDVNSLQQVLMNLCVNARDAMPDGGELCIATEQVVLSEADCEPHPIDEPGEYVVFRVSDTGHGMAKHVQQRMFDPFFTTRSVGEGTGLGLAMVYGTVQQHGGFVQVDSEVGAGTTIELVLPAANADVRPRLEPMEATI